MKTNEALAKLKLMAAKAGDAIYERACLARDVLADQTWIDAEFASDMDKAHEVIEVEYFPELHTAFGLGRLLALLATFPTLAEWKTHKCNLMRLWAAHMEQDEKTRPKSERRGAKLADVQARDERIKELEWSLKSSKDGAQAREKETAVKLSRIERENAELRIEIAELRGENKALLRMVEEMRTERHQSVR